MDEFPTEKSCWGVTFWAVAVFAGALAIGSAVLDEGEVPVADGATSTVAAAPGPVSR